MDSYRWVLFKINLRDNKKNVSLNRSLTRWFWISPSASYSWTHSTSITGSPANCRAYQSLSFSSLACMSKFFQFCNIYLWVYCFIYQMISTLDSSPQNKAKKFSNDFINLVISKKNCVLNWIYANQSKVSLLICCITCILGPLLVRLSLLVSSLLHDWKKIKDFQWFIFLTVSSKPASVCPHLFLGRLVLCCVNLVFWRHLHVVGCNVFDNHCS